MEENEANKDKKPEAVADLEVTSENAEEIQAGTGQVLTGYTGTVRFTSCDGS